MSVCDASMNQARTTTFVFFFFNDTATTEIYTLSLHDALPIIPHARVSKADGISGSEGRIRSGFHETCFASRTNLPGNPGGSAGRRYPQSDATCAEPQHVRQRRRESARGDFPPDVSARSHRSD